MCKSESIFFSQIKGAMEILGVHLTSPFMMIEHEVTTTSVNSVILGGYYFLDRVP
jgi:hypothetical protein